MEETFVAYQRDQTQECHFLLQEMCRDVAQQALDQGNEKQKALSLKLIDRAKTAIEQHCSQQELKLRQACQLGSAHVTSLSFVAPHIIEHTPSLKGSKPPSLKADPVFVKPSVGADIIDYLQQFKLNFIGKLINSKNLDEVALLSHGIEAFLIDFLANTDILLVGLIGDSFSENDLVLASLLKELAEVYCSCQVQLVNVFLSNLTYQPEFYAKNVIIQFFVYAAIAALNYRHERVGPLLATHNLSVAISESLSFIEIIPHLVIKDAAWLKVAHALEVFFTPEEDKDNLFSYSKFQGTEIFFEITNKAEQTDTDVRFAYQLLQTDQNAFSRFNYNFRELEDEKMNRKWQKLAYTDQYLPALYCVLSKVAHFAKASLTGLPSGKGNAPTRIDWHFKNSTWWSGPRWAVNRKCFWRSRVSFQINSINVSTNFASNQVTSYMISCNGKDPYQRLITRKLRMDKPHSHLLENEIIASQDKKPNTMDRIRYMQLGCLQSEPLLKLGRLYIALKEQQLDFGSEQESVLIKQTLFEVSILLETNNGFCSLLEWTANCNPVLIHKLGVLCIDKAKTMQYRLTQHNAIGNIVEVTLALLTFYPPAYRNEFIEGIVDIYYLLKEVLAEPSSNLSDHTVLHLNAYLVISLQCKPQLLETETLTVLKALLAIQNYKAKGVELDNSILLRVHLASINLSRWIDYYVDQNQTILNDLMLSVIPQWKRGSKWQRSNIGVFYTCGNHTVKPLLGGIYFQNQPVVGLPDSITENHVFKKYLGRVSFAVIPGSRKIGNGEVPCYLSVDSTQQMRLTLIKENVLYIEEFIDGDYQRYIPAKELLGLSSYPLLLYYSAHNKETLRHWLDDKEILVKDHKRQIIYQWDLETNSLFSIQHKGYVVPWEQLKGLAFKTWIRRIEEPGWIEIIAQLTADESIRIQSLHFPRLGIHFDLMQGKFWCKQVHGYFLAEQQHINTLHGFLNYLVLEKKERNSMNQVTKVIIPHWKVTPTDSFTAATVRADFTTVQSPAYFVYDYDPKTGLLKAQNTRAQLYLALLYYCSASLDNHDVSNCNGYHLARENLEVCWKDQPFDEIELDIIDQFLSPSAMRDFHSNRIALYLKVVSLLRSSQHLAFLYTDEAALQSKKRSDELLKKCKGFLPFLLLQYLQNKSVIFERIKLNVEEEEDVVKQCLLLLTSSHNSEEPRIASIISTLQGYYQLNFGQLSHVVLPAVTKRSYKDHYKQLFSRDALIDTSFLNLCKSQIDLFSFLHDPEEINFSSGFNGVLLDRFRLSNFINLYNLAKSSSIHLTKYCYLLHHMVFKAKALYDRFPEELILMLARVLLLVAEKPEQFPKPPNWFGVSKHSVDLSKRSLVEDDLLSAFPSFSWKSEEIYNTWREEDEAKRAAEMEDFRENKKIWSLFERHDLDDSGVPHCLPKNRDAFTLKYEFNMFIKDTTKQDIVRQLYLEAAYNDVMYQFFVNILQQCDRQKYGSAMGWSITPFVDSPISVTIMAENSSNPIPEPVSLEKWAIPQQPLVALDKFFNIIQQPVKNTNFLFDSQLENPDNVYEGHFYQELKESWLAYHKEPELIYSWLNAQSRDNLESVLQKKFDQIRKKAEQSWSHITAQLKKRPNGESDNYFGLRWHSGQVSHYHKGDVLRLLVEPHKLTSYNPNCGDKRDSIIQSLLNYVICEIHAAKIVRVLAFIEKCKQTESEEEQFSVLHGLVKSLQEDIDPASFRYPHWFLFQLENEIIVRENQRELIEAMLNQTEKAMYQLNMGEGKSSVILPLLSNNLADGEKLLRINVLSALLITMKNFLRQCCSGLIRKRIYTLPFHRDTDISPERLMLIFETLKTCQRSQHILLVTPEQRLCLQLKVRELMLEHQQQMAATNIFSWKMYRQRAPHKPEVYSNLPLTEVENLLARQDKCLRKCLLDEKYINSDNWILKVPPRGQGRTAFGQFKETISDPSFREWSCLKAAYYELLYNSKIAHDDTSEKLVLLNKICALPAVDLLDESDEILRHGTELNYTVGDKHVFAGGELRWQIPQFFIQAIFCDPELRKIIARGKPDGFTVLNEHYSPRGGVPFIQLLDESYFNDHIKPLLIKKFFVENLPTLRKYNVSPDKSLFENEASSPGDYIAGQLPSGTERKMMAFLADKDRLKDKLLIAKGWLSHGILFHVFNAKYRVQYGLNLQGLKTRPIAVPFMGKDSPSPRSEFSHPDVMLGFTIISYLYEGLDQKQSKETLMRLKDKFCHQVADKYLQTWAEAGRAWIQLQTDTFPPELLTSFVHVDLADEQCLEKVHQYLSGNHLAILYYLNQFILLQEASQYLHKISANAHSLVGYDAALGFSGTDDRKLTMPFEVKSLRSVTQEGTNGKLLSVLTQKRNSRYYSLQVEDTNDLLKQLCKYVATQPHCHALIDAGALVTGLSNYEAASFLLTNLPAKFMGVVYFSDEGNTLTVLTRARDSPVIALQDCYFDKQYLFAYLDDIHTRGTDIKLPLNCHAILTVSMGMEKDKLMQAAMRLRQLAQKQSVSLWGTQAVTLAIARDNSVNATKINSFEVIKWVTRNTIDHINTDLFPVAVRKISFQFLKKAEAWLKEAPTTLDSLVQYCQEKELFLLEDFYGLTPQCQDLADCLYCLVSGRIRMFWQEIERELRNKELTHTDFYKKVFNQFDKNEFRRTIDTISREIVPYLQMGLVRSSLDNDEEKEVEVEIIQEQEVLIKVERREPCLEVAWDTKLILRRDFIKIAEQNNLIIPLSAIGHYIQMPANLKNIIWHPDIYMTANFIQSVASKRKDNFDNYLRPVDAMLAHRLTNKTVIVLLSGQEASQIKSTCSSSNNLILHLNDINGPTQFPTSSFVSKKEQKLLTIVRLFSGECHYSPSSEVLRLSKRVGRLYPHYFTKNVSIDHDCSQKLYGNLIEKGYLDFSGVMTKKLLKVLDLVDFGDSPSLELTRVYQPYHEHVLQKLFKVYTKLIINPLSPLKDSHNTLWQWVGTRGKLKEFVGSELESIINSEYKLKY